MVSKSDEGMKSMERSFYLIDSIKGGCGKTTFAIMLTEFLERMQGRTGHTVLLDFDFLGTGLINLFLSEDQLKDFKQNNIYITEKIRDFHTGDQPYIYSKKVKGIPLYVAFGNPEYMTKHAYRISSKFNYTPVINYGIFRSGIQHILHDEDALERQIRGNVKNIVIDMSPGIDSYSEAVKECFFDKRHSLNLKGKTRCTYVLMMGTDPSHVAAAKNYFELLVNSDDKMPDKIYIIINDSMRIARLINPDAEIDSYNALVNLFRQISIGPEYQERIEFFVLNYFENYAKKIHENIALFADSIESSEDGETIFLDNPFRFWGTWTSEGLKEIKGSDYDSEEMIKWEEWLLKE